MTAMKENWRKISLAAFCIYLVAVALLCFLKPSSLPEMDVKTLFGLPIDKVLHFLMFLPFPILAGMSFISGKLKLRRNIVTLLVLTFVGIGLAYGTEIIQSQTGYRSYEIADFKADIIGICTGSIIASGYLIYTKFKK